MATKRVYQKSERTPEQIAKEQDVRDKYQREKPSLEQLVAEGGTAVPLGMLIQLHEIFAALKRQRESIGMTLSTLSEKSGIDVATLSKLESGKHDNPTLSTISRVSSALGKRVRYVIEDAGAKGM